MASYTRREYHKTILPQAAIPSAGYTISHDLSIRANPLPEAAVQGSLAVSNELLERVMAGHQGLSHTRNALSALP